MVISKWVVMHRLVRKVRFFTNPFLDARAVGSNSYGGKPCGEGLGIFLELEVGLVGQAEPASGFVVNVVDIDKIVRQFAVPVIEEAVKQQYRHTKHIGSVKLNTLMAEVRDVLKGKFDNAMLIDMALHLSPYRKIAFDCEDMKMFYLSEKFDFASMHKLWNNELSEQENFELFGKCANPNGHGHNYVVEVTVKAPSDEEIRIGDLETAVDEKFIKLVDHKNLNADVDQLKNINPTIENIASFAWEKLNGQFGTAKLHSVSVWESDRTFCTYYG